MWPPHRWRLLIILPLTLLFRPGSAAEILDAFSIETANVSVLGDLLLELKATNAYGGLLVDNCQGVAAVSDIILKSVNTPTLLSTGTQKVYWRTRYNNGILAVMCLPAGTQNAQNAGEALDGLAATLHHMRESRIVLVVDSTDRRSLVAHFKYCVALKMLNVIAVLADFAHTGAIYGFENFPQFRLTRWLHKATHDELFPNKVNNIQGHPIFTLPDQLAPRSFFYYDRRGRRRLSGYVAKMLQTFAGVINGTLSFPYRVQTGEIIYVIDLHKYTDAGIIDIAAGLGGPKALLNVNEYSMYVELAWWRPMLPVERNLEVHEMFMLLFRSDLVVCLTLLAISLSVLLTMALYRQRLFGGDFWRDLLLNDKSLRGVLAQSFPMDTTPEFRVGFIFTMIFATGLLTSTLYGAYLNSFLTEPPTLPRINTFDELCKSDTKILIWEKELSPLTRSLGPAAWQRYKDCFQFVDSWHDFLQRRSTQNASHAYAVTSSLWPLIETQQEVFQRKLFRVSPDIVIETRISFSLPVHENSIYKSKVNSFVLNMHQAGLMHYWRTQTLFDLMENGTMSFMDVSNGRQFNAMMAKDFHWIWLIYVVAMLFSVCIFMGELVTSKLNGRRAKLANNVWAEESCSEVAVELN